VLLEAPRCRGKACVLRSVENTGRSIQSGASRLGACLSWSYPVPRSSWRRRSGYWVHRSPLGVQAPSGFSVVLSSFGFFRIRATTSSNLGSASEALPGTADLVLALTSQASGRLLPWTLLPVQRSRRMESDSRPKIPSSAPSPLGGSHVLRGLILYSPCHHLQMADTLRVLPFRAFFLPDPCSQLVAGAALFDVSLRSAVRSVARRCARP